MPEGNSSQVRWLRELVQWILAIMPRQIEGFDTHQTSDGVIFKKTSTTNNSINSGDYNIPRWG